MKGRIMRLPQFEHLAPSTIEEACAFLAAHGNSALPLAGGTDLLVKMKNRKVVPQYIVNLKNISGLDHIRYDDADGLRVGALVTIQALKNSVIVKRKCNILAQAAAAESSVQIRNIATLGGNIANASPAADAPLALIAAGASAVLTGVGGQREVLLEDFFTAPGKTILQPGELVSEIHVPPMPPQTGTAYLKHAVRRTDIAIVAVGVVLTLEKKVCSAIKIVLSSVAPTIIRAREAEALLVGKVLTDDLISGSARLAADESSPINDIRRTAQYRTSTIIEATKTTILHALQDAKAGGL
jgi:CO/xanthine dehydrogenase FAD-binding subunit